MMVDVFYVRAGSHLVFTDRDDSLNPAVREETLRADVDERVAAGMGRVLTSSWMKSTHARDAPAHRRLQHRDAVDAKL